MHKTISEQIKEAFNNIKGESLVSIVTCDITVDSRMSILAKRREGQYYELLFTLKDYTPQMMAHLTLARTENYYTGWNAKMTNRIHPDDK